MKVLIIRDKTLSFNGGIKRHCDFAAFHVRLGRSLSERV